MKTIILSLFITFLSPIAWGYGNKISIEKMRCFKNGKEHATVAQVRQGDSYMNPYILDFLGSNGKVVESVKFNVGTKVESGSRKGFEITPDGIKYTRVKYYSISGYFEMENRAFVEYSGFLDLLVENNNKVKTAQIIKDDEVILECE